MNEFHSEHAFVSHFVHRTLSPDIFSHGMVQYVQESCFCKPGNWVLMPKPIFFTLGSWKYAASSCQKNPLVHFPLHCNSFGWVFYFSERRGLFATSCHEVPWVLFHLISVTADMAVNTQITLSSDLFSHGKLQCVLGVSLHSSETAGKHDFVNLGIGAWWQKKYFPTVKAG